MISRSRWKDRERSDDPEVARQFAENGFEQYNVIQNCLYKNDLDRPPEENEPLPVKDEKKTEE